MSELPVSPDDLRALATLFAPGIVADPYPAYARWRAERPVARPRERLYVLSRFADCEAVLASFAKAGIDIDALATRLQDEGAKSFVESWKDLMSRIEAKSVAIRKAG